MDDSDLANTMDIVWMPARVAKYLGVGVPRVYEMARQGLIPCVHLGRQIRFSVKMLREWQDQGGKQLPGGWKKS